VRLKGLSSAYRIDERRYRTAGAESAGFTEVMRSHTQIPIEYRDERLTTVEAQRLHQESGSKRKPEYPLRCDGGGSYSTDYLEEAGNNKKRESDI